MRNLMLPALDHIQDGEIKHLLCLLVCVGESFPADAESNAG